MKRWVLLSLLLLSAGCADEARDPIEPPVVDLCPGCGPSDLFVESYEVRLPTSEQVVRSGDTINVRAVIRNAGAMAADTTTAATVSMSSAVGSFSVHVPVGRIARDSTATVNMSLVVPIIPSNGSRSSTVIRQPFRISVYGGDDIDYANNSVSTMQYLYEPNIVRVTGPDSIRAGVSYSFTFEVVNRSRYAIPATTISTCLMYFGCKNVVTRFPMPAVAAGTTATMPFTFRVIPDPEMPPMPYNPVVVACYGQAAFSSVCSGKDVVFLP
jgi:hypothetical protein